MSFKIVVLAMLGLTLAAAPTVQAARGGHGGRRGSSFRAGRVGRSNFRAFSPRRNFRAHRSVRTGRFAKSGGGFRKFSGSGRKGRLLSTRLRRSLMRHGLARSFAKFRFRSWSSRWRTWMFYNSGRRCWYFYSRGCGCWLPSDDIAYDPPQDGGLPDDLSTAWNTPQLPSNDSPVQPPSPPDNPPPVPDEDNVCRQQ